MRFKATRSFTVLFATLGITVSSQYSIAQSSPWNCERSASGAWICTPSEDGFSKTEPAPLPETFTETDTSTEEPSTTQPAAVEAELPAQKTREVAADTQEPEQPVTEETSTTALEDISKPARGQLPAAWCLMRKDLPQKQAPADRNVQATIWAKEAEAIGEQYELTGDVRLDRADQQLEADTVHYDKTKNYVEAEGNIFYSENGLAMTGDSGFLWLDTNAGEFANVIYRLPTDRANGTADKITMKNEDLTILSNASYTTCMPDSPVWSMHGGTVTIDEVNNRGVGRNVVLRIKDFPVFYTPYISFPLRDERKTGFLFPGAGREGDSGYATIVPFYWNIAPNRDATIIVRNYQKRGQQLETNYRYLGYNHQGELTATYLPNDELYGDEDRWIYNFQHTGTVMPHLTTNINLNETSDREYLTDFATVNGITTVTHLEKLGELHYTQDNWSLTGRARGYQALQGTKPYQSLPQITFESEFEDPLGLNYELLADAVHYTRKNSVTAKRFHLEPRISKRFEDLAYFVSPAVTLQYTHYSLDNVAVGNPNSINRTVPTFSLDSGIFLERESSLFDWKYIQTLEPRLFYVRTPYKDQSNINVFDTGQNTFTFDQLFREDRFSGPDRIGDANQITAAITTRFIESDTGVERFSASVGQIYYTDERRVTIGGAPQTEHSSDIAARATARIYNNITASAEYQWNPHIDQRQTATASLRYSPAKNHLINLGYRFQRDSLEQTDLSFVLPILNNWEIFGRYNYSMLNHQPLETIAGFQYESCCWMFRLAHHRYLDIDGLFSGGTDEAILFNVVLKGLGGAGRALDKIMEESILGYEAD